MSKSTKPLVKNIVSINPGLAKIWNKHFTFSTHDFTGMDLQSLYDELDSLINKVAKESKADILEQFEPLLHDHSKCFDNRTCIGYQNAESDFDNIKQDWLKDIREGKL